MRGDSPRAAGLRSEFGNASVRLFDRDGALGANVMSRVGAGHGGGVHVFGPNGRLAAALRTDTHGAGFLVAYDEQGREATLTPR